MDSQPVHTGAGEDEDLAIPQTAMVQIARMLGMRSLANVACLDRSWAQSLRSNPRLWSAFGDDLGTVTGGPQADWKRPHETVLDARASAFSTVHSGQAWAKGLFASTGVSQADPILSLGWLTSPNKLLQNPDAGKPIRVIASGHVSGAVSLYAACTHSEDGSVLASPSLGLLRKFTLDMHTGPVTGIARIPTGTVLPDSFDIVTAGHDGTVRVSSVSVQGLLDGRVEQDSDAWTPKHTWGELAIGASVNGVAVQSDDALVAAAVDDGSLVLLRADSGAALTTFAAHSRSTYCVDFAPQGGLLPTTVLASGGFDPCARVWDLRTSGPSAFALPQLPPAAVRKAGWKRRGHALKAARRSAHAGIAGTSDEWDRAPGVNPLHVPLPGHDYRGYDVAWSPCGTLLATAGGDTIVRVWDIRHIEEPLHIHRQLKRWPESLAWLGGTRALAASGPDLNVRVWSHTKYGKPRHTKHEAVWATAGDCEAEDFGASRALLGAPLPCEARFQGTADKHASMVTAILSDGEHTLCSASADGTLTLRAQQPFEQVHLPAPPAAVQKSHGHAALPPRLLRRMAKRENLIRADSAGAYRLAAGTPALTRQRYLVSSAPVDVHAGQVYHTTLRQDVVEGIVKCLPSAAWQQGGSGTVHRTTALAMANKAHSKALTLLSSSIPPSSRSTPR